MWAEALPLRQEAEGLRQLRLPLGKGKGGLRSKESPPWSSKACVSSWPTTTPIPPKLSALQKEGTDPQPPRPRGWVEALWDPPPHPRLQNSCLLKAGGPRARRPLRGAAARRDVLSGRVRRKTLLHAVPWELALARAGGDFWLFWLLASTKTSWAKCACVLRTPSALLATEYLVPRKEKRRSRTWGSSGCRREPAESLLGRQFHSWSGSSRHSQLGASCSTCKKGTSVGKEGTLLSWSSPPAALGLAPHGLAESPPSPEPPSVDSSGPGRAICCALSLSLT